MKRFVVSALLALFVSSVVFAQGGPKTGPAVAGNSPTDVAKAAVAAHGGEKLRALKSLLVKGSVDISVMGQAMPGAFSTAYSGDKYFFEITSPVQQMKQVYDGRQMFSSVAPFSLPPVTSVGFPLMSRIGDTGYAVGALPDKSKKRGFRVTAPDGFYTDFFVDEKTGRVKSYQSAFEVNGQVVTTSVDIDEYHIAEGLTLPKKYAQRFDLGTLTAYATFKGKDFRINQPIEDSAFKF